MIGTLLCSAAMATVGTSVVASRLIGAYIEPFAATAMRHALALPVLLLLCWLVRPGLRWPGGRDALVLLVQAAAGSVGYTVLLITGTSLASAADAGIVAGTLPAMAALFAVVVLGERPGRASIAGIALATAGVMVLSIAGAAPTTTLPEAPRRWLGITLVLAAVACEVVFILGQRALRTTPHPLAMATLMSAGGLLLSLPVALVISAWSSPPQPGPVAWSAFAAVAWYAWVPTVIGFWLWYAGARRATATHAAVSTACLPVVAVIASAVVLGESVSLEQWAALALVLAGVAIGAFPVGRPRARWQATTRPAAASPGPSALGDPLVADEASSAARSRPLQ
jgi:drug/metabolite transporter (DMT)-like permease